MTCLYIKQRQSFSLSFYHITDGVNVMWRPSNVSPYITIVQRLYFHFLLDHWANCGIFENGVLLMYTLEGISSVANFISAYVESQ